MAFLFQTSNSSTGFRGNSGLYGKVMHKHRKAPREPEQANGRPDRLARGLQNGGP